MATLPENRSIEIDELESVIIEMESRLESDRAERDEAKARQAELEIENSSLRRELNLAREQQKASADILSVISSSVADTEPVFESILSSIKHLFDGEESLIFLTSEEGLLQIAAARGANAEAGRERFPIPIEGTASELAIRERRLVRSADVQNDPDVPVDLRETARRVGQNYSMAIAPMLWEDKAIGTIFVGRTSMVPFTDRECELLNSFADQAVIAIQNARLVNDTREALERQTATADILKVIASSPSDVLPVFRAIADSAKQLLDGFSATVLHFIGDELHLVAFTPTNPAADEGLQASFPRRVTELPIFELVRDGATIQFPDTEAEDVPATNRDLGRLRGFRSVLFVPLMNQGKAVGILSVTRTKPGAFAKHHVQLLQTFADQAVIAIENARLFNETRETLERQTATAEILKVIASSPSDVRPVFDAIAHSANRLIGGFSAAVFRYRDGQIHLAAFTPTDAEGDTALQSSFPIPLEQFPPYQLTREGAPAELPDTELEPAARDIARARGYRSMLFAPLMNDGAAVGIITVTRVGTGSFGEQHTRLLQMFADQAVIAIRNVGLFNEVQARTEDLSESLRQQTAVGDVLKTISRSTFELQPVLDTLVQSAAHLCDADMAFIMRRVDDEYRAGAAVGYTEAYIDFLTNHPLAVNRGTVTGRAVLDRRPVQILDVMADPEYTLQETYTLASQRTTVGVPLLRENEPIGVIVLARRRVEPFTQKQIDLVATFADQAVIAIENVRLFNEVRQRTDDLTEALTYQTGSANILNVIASSPTDVQPVLKAIVESACELCEAYDAVVSLKDGEELELSAHHGPIPMNRRRWPADRSSVSGRAIADQRPVHVKDVLAEEGQEFAVARDMSIADGCHTLLSAPLLREGEPIGAITLRRAEVHPFSDKQIALLQTFADQAVIAIGNVRLFQEVQARTHELTESLEQQTATSEVLQAISSSQGDLAPVFDAMLGKSMQLCGANFGVLNTYDGSRFHTAATYGLPPAYDEFRRKQPLDYGPGTAPVRMLQGEPHVEILHLIDSEPYRRGDANRRALVDIGGARSLLAVPLLRDKRVVGNVLIFRQEDSPFSEKQIALLKQFAAQAVIAIENARLLNELRQRTSDLSQSLDNLRTAQDRLVQTEKLASLGQLTAGIAHEIKNPLNFVNNFAAVSAELTEELNDALKQAEVGEQIRAEVDELTGLLRGNLEKVVQHGKRADSIVKNMLLHSREGGGEHRPSDINALVDESLNLAYHGARAEKPGFNVTLERDFDPAAGQIDLFPQEITRVILNLVSNGFHAVTQRNKEGGEPGFEPTLRTSTKNLGESVEIRIRDNGTGIPPEVKEKMFNPFFTTKPAGEGTGLGLSMSHDIIVKQHGGTIDVDTERGHFTEFRIVLPRTSNFAEKSRG